MIKRVRGLNSSGFTLIELLATISILAILALMAVPNIVGVTERNKDKTYLEDAKKMISLAEYKVNSDSGYKPKTAGSSVCITMNELGGTNFAIEKGKAPNKGKYDVTKSYVKVENKTVSGKTVIQYTVQLVEEKDGKYFGIQPTTKGNLYNSTLTELIRKNKAASAFSTCSGGSYSTGNNFQVGGTTGGSASSYYNIPSTSATN